MLLTGRIENDSEYQEKDIFEEYGRGSLKKKMGIFDKEINFSLGTMLSRVKRMHDLIDTKIDSSKFVISITVKKTQKMIDLI